jgi:hypothetical protein
MGSFRDRYSRDSDSSARYAATSSGRDGGGFGVLHLAFLHGAESAEPASKAAAGIVLLPILFRRSDGSADLWRLLGRHLPPMRQCAGISG